MRTYALPLLAVLAAACAATEAPALDPAPPRTSAALASVVVDNRTAERLTILFHPTLRPTLEVIIGHAAPLQTTALAPVPAHESIVFRARTSAGAELVLEPRSLTLDTTWTWLIQRDARFLQSRTVE